MYKRNGKVLCANDNKCSKNVVITTSENVIADLIKWEKLDEINYGMTLRRSIYVLNEVEVLERITNIMMQPKEGNTAQHVVMLKCMGTW